MIIAREITCTVGDLYGVIKLQVQQEVIMMFDQHDTRSHDYDDTMIDDWADMFAKIARREHQNNTQDQFTLAR